MKRMQAGFTLIELMIVVAIIAILAGMALPLYQNYIGKTQTARVVEESAVLRSVIETCLNEGRSEIGADPDQCDPGATGSDIIDGATQGAIILASGTGVPQVTNTAGIIAIEATFGGSAMADLQTQKVTWTRSLEGTWTCVSTVAEKYKSRGC